MACKRCSSEHQRKFRVEMNLHFPDYEGLTKPTVWLFPEVVVCLDCGCFDGTIPKLELRKLDEGTAA